MTAYLWSALQSHPWWSLLIFALVFSFLATVYLLAYHGSGPQLDVTHRGPYRPPPSKDDPRYEATRDRQRELRDAMRANFTPHDPELQQRAKDAVADYRGKELAAGRPLKGRRT